MKVAFYTAPFLLTSEQGDTGYIYEALARHFDVTLHSQPDASLCRDAHVVFCRFPLPLDRQFLRQLVPLSDKLIINNPAAQLRYGTKRHLLLFPELTAPTMITASVPDIRRFALQYGPVVFKPLDRHMGKGVIRIDVAAKTDGELERLVSDYVDEYGTPAVQQYIDCVTEVGDKRIIIFRFDPISAVTTMPAAGSFICHESSGGSAFPAEITARDAEIVDAVMPFLRRNEIWWAAVDVIGTYLGEVNICTPSMMWRADRAHGSTRGSDAVIRKLKEHQKEHGL